MKLRLPYQLAAAAGLWFSSLGLAQDAAPPAFLTPPVSASALADQQIADAVATRLGQAPNLRGFQADIVVVNGAVELSGTVTDLAQRNEIIKIARAVPGVHKVSDQLTISTAIVPVAGQEATLPGPMPMGPGGAGAPMGPLPGPGIDPTPLNGPGIGSRIDLSPPSMPPYAWPTYAPHNNYSRVGYPEQYPSSAFPYIGPFYPFPKVPLGYRAIKLEWEDGHWWYGRTAVKHDWWTVRYW